MRTNKADVLTVGDKNNARSFYLNIIYSSGSDYVANNWEKYAQLCVNEPYLTKFRRHLFPLLLIFVSDCRCSVSRDLAYIQSGWKLIVLSLEYFTEIHKVGENNITAAFQTNDEKSWRKWLESIRANFADK